MGSAVERSVALTDEMMGGADYAEGVRAWTERRNPDFPDPLALRSAPWRPGCTR